MADCIFCKIVAGQMPTDIIFQDDQLMVFRDIHPKAPVHLLIVSKEHIKSLYEIDEQHANLMGQMLLTLPKMAKMAGLSNGFRTIVNTGAGGGQVIDHIHFHLLGGGNLPHF